MTATITTTEFCVDVDTFEKEVDDAYTELALLQALDNTDMDAVEAIIAASGETTPVTFEQTLLFDKVTHCLRPSRKARDMTRKGGRFVIRTDHGTKTFYREVAEVNAGRNTRQMNSNAQKRRAAKLAGYSGNPRVITKLKRLGDLLVD